MHKTTLPLTQGALIGALYVILTLLSQMFGLASGPIQVRLSEMLTILPLFTWAAVPGLTIGCLIGNFLTGCHILDMIFGSLATFIGGLGTYYIGRKFQSIGPIFPICSNMLIIPWVLENVYGAEGSYWYFAATVGIGEVVSCGILGMLLYRALTKTKLF